MTPITVVQGAYKTFCTPDPVEIEGETRLGLAYAQQGLGDLTQWHEVVTELWQASEAIVAEYISGWLRFSQLADQRRQ